MCKVKQKGVECLKDALNPICRGSARDVECLKDVGMRYLEVT